MVVQFSLRGQTVHFMNSTQSSQQVHSLCSSFVFSFSLNCSDEALRCLKTCLWSQETYRHKIVRLSSAQLGLVILTKCNEIFKNFKRKNL